MSAAAPHSFGEFPAFAGSPQPIVVITTVVHKFLWFRAIDVLTAAHRRLPYFVVIVGGTTIWSGPRKRSFACGHCGTRGHSTAEIGRRLGVSKECCGRQGAPARSAGSAVADPARRIGRGSSATALDAPPRRRPDPATAFQHQPDRCVGACDGAEFRTTDASTDADASAGPGVAAAAATVRADRDLLLADRRAGDAQFLLLRRRVGTGKPYCDDHAQLAYVRLRDRREDAA